MIIVGLPPKLANRQVRNQVVEPAIVARFKADFHRAETRVCANHHAEISIERLDDKTAAEVTDTPKSHDCYVGRCDSCGGYMYRAFENPIKARAIKAGEL